MRNALFSAALLFALLLPEGGAAAPPVSGDAIPVFAGAARDEAAEQADALRALYQWKGIRDGSEWVRVYLSPRPAQELFAFYRDALAAEEGDGAEIDLRALPPGTVTPAAYGTKVEEGALRWAGLSWVAAGADGAVTGFRIGVEGLPEGKGTRLVLWRETLVQPEAH